MLTKSSCGLMLCCLLSAELYADNIILEAPGYLLVAEPETILYLNQSRSQFLVRTELVGGEDEDLSAEFNALYLLKLVYNVDCKRVTFKLHSGVVVDRFTGQVVHSKHDLEVDEQRNANMNRIMVNRFCQLRTAKP